MKAGRTWLLIKNGWILSTVSGWISYCNTVGLMLLLLLLLE